MVGRRGIVRKLVYIDTETTGLDPFKDEIVELSYAVEEGEIHTLYFGVTEVPDFIDQLIGFSERGISGIKSPEEDFERFLAVTEGQTMVGANPAFDRAFLEANGLYKFGYRMLDIESYAMAKLRLDYVPGMKDVFEELRSRGYCITEPMHTSHSDVSATREAHYIIEGI